MIKFLKDERKSTLLAVELATQKRCAEPIAKLVTKIQGDGFDYVTRYADVVALGDALDAGLPEDLVKELESIADDASHIAIAAPPPPPAATPAPAAVEPVQRERRAAAVEGARAAADAVRGRPLRAAEPVADEPDPPMLDNVDDLKEFAAKMMAPATAYLKSHILNESSRDSSQLTRMRVAAYFDPISVLPTTERVDDVLEAFPCFEKHPKLESDSIGPKIKNEIPIYKALIDQIPRLDERLNDKGKDTFDIEDFWKRAAHKLPSTCLALRAVLTHSPNSAPPERVFSIMKNSFDDDQTQALNDYVELSLSLQYNKRGRRVGA